MKYASVDVYLKDQLFDHLELSLEGDYITFPSRLPYQGLEYYINYRGDYYSFSPDGYEMTIKFSNSFSGTCIEYLQGKSYKLVFLVIEK